MSQFAAMSAPAWLDELPLAPGPPWHAMGTRALEERDWLVVDGDRDEQLAYKRDLLAAHHDVVAVARPGSEAAASEAAALVGAPDLEAAALRVQEDLCVLVRRDDRWCLDAGVVCFPSMWRLADKLGRPMAEVHGPVPAYADELADRVDRFLDRLERPAWRRNWFVHDSPELHLPEPPPPHAAPAVPEGLWLRSERQTLRPLPASGGILFAIRTQQVPLAVVAERPDVAARMAEAMAAWSPELVAYRGAAAWRDAVVRWLSRSGPPGRSDRPEPAPSR
ncbi:MAG: hypothetical protein JWN67_988 [Actinomycetia bacterium]|nr:hypothetical protein [Actinomycetes bacterium]